MTGGEIAALITALGGSIGGILMALAALRNARYSKDRVQVLEKQIEVLSKAIVERDQEIISLQQHNVDQDRILLDREQQIASLRKENEMLNQKIAKWHEWGVNMGRVFNGLQLEVGWLQKQLQQQSPPRETAPLPPDVEE